MKAAKRWWREKNKEEKVEKRGRGRPREIGDSEKEENRKEQKRKSYEKRKVEKKEKEMKVALFTKPKLPHPAESETGGVDDNVHDDCDNDGYPGKENWVNVKSGDGGFGGGLPSSPSPPLSSPLSPAYP